MDYKAGGSVLQRQYVIEQSRQQSQLKSTVYNMNNTSRIQQRKDRIDTEKRAGRNNFCCRNGKVFLMSLLLGLLIAAVPLATVMTIWLNPRASNTTTSTTTSVTATTTVTTAALATFTPSTATCNSTAITPCTTTTSIVATCQSYEVSWNGRCYYLDGSGGTCAAGYSQATNGVLTCINTQFAGKTYRNTTSNNCCVWTADTYQCYGLSPGCNAAGPFTSGPVLAGAGCKNLQLRNTQQLTFCGSI